MNTTILTSPDWYLVFHGVTSLALIAYCLLQAYPKGDSLSHPPIGNGEPRAIATVPSRSPYRGAGIKHTNGNEPIAHDSAIGSPQKDSDLAAQNQPIGSPRPIGQAMFDQNKL